METIKATVSHVLGTSKSTDPDTTTDSSLGPQSGTTGTTSTLGHDDGTNLGHHGGNTGITGTTGASAPTVHDQTTTGSGSTFSHGTSGTTTTGGDTSLGRDSTGITGASGLSSGHSAAHDTTHGTGTSHTTTGTSDTTGLSSGHDSTIGGRTTDTTHSTTGTTSHTTSSSDITRGRDTNLEDSSSSRHHHDPREVQSPEQGPDPALVGDAKEHPKLTGQGAPGSHSAVFGLTPDGKKYTESDSGTTPLQPAHSDKTSGIGRSVAGESGRDAVAGGHGGVSDQIDAPDHGKKGLARKDDAPIAESGSGGKPGAGLSGFSQGSGQV